MTFNEACDYILKHPGGRGILSEQVFDKLITTRSFFEQGIGFMFPEGRLPLARFRLKNEYVRAWKIEGSPLLDPVNYMATTDWFVIDMDGRQVFPSTWEPKVKQDSTITEIDGEKYVLVKTTTEYFKKL